MRKWFHLDQYIPALQQMRDNTDNMSLQNCTHEFICSRAEEMPLFANSFDLIFGGLCLGYLSPVNMLEFLARSAICLRPEGIMLFRDHISVILDDSGAETFASFDDTRGYIRYDYPNISKIVTLAGC